MSFHRLTKRPAVVYLVFKIFKFFKMNTDSTYIPKTIEKKYFISTKAKSSTIKNRKIY